MTFIGLKKSARLAMSVDHLELSVRPYNCIRAANIKTIKELVANSAEDLLKMKNLGRSCLTEIRAVLKEQMGLRLKGEK